MPKSHTNLIVGNLKKSLANNFNQKTWFDENIESNHIEQVHTLDSSVNKTDLQNPYKRSPRTKSKVANTSNSDRILQQISEIHQHSKENSEDINGTLMNSIVNLFPNKFKSKSNSSKGAKALNPASSSTNSQKDSFSKEELQEKLRRIQKNRENSGEYMKVRDHNRRLIIPFFTS